jgi:hypothetical protein
MQKKTYAAPTLTTHGRAVETTRGNFGFRLEFINFRLF